MRDAVPPDVPVLAGTGATSADRAAELTAAASGAGADAVLAWPPPGSEDLAGYYAAVGQAAAGLPVLAYHIPWSLAPGVPVAALDALPVAGLKDSSGDAADRLLAEVAHYPGCTDVGVVGAAGPGRAARRGAAAILAIANVEPELCCAAFAAHAGAQLRLIDMHLAARDGRPLALKQILAQQRGSNPLSRTAGAGAPGYGRDS